MSIAATHGVGSWNRAVRLILVGAGQLSQYVAAIAISADYEESW